jgi:hypothetical protein
LAQGEQRNKWQGPAAGGKDAVYAGCELEPTQWSATDGVWVLIGSFSIEVFFLFSLFCSSIFRLPQRLLSERELLVVLGLSFYPLEQS